MVGETIEQGGGHLGIAEDGGILLHRDFGRLQKQSGQCAHDRVPFLHCRSCSVVASSAMLSCRGSPGGPAGTGKDFIELLPANGSVIGGALSKTLADEKLVKRGKGGHRCTRRTDLHAGARRRIEHPGGYLDDQPGLCLYRGSGAVGTLFNTFKAYSPTKQCMPTIVNDAILPEMGGMNARSVSGANPGCSRAPIAAASGRQ